MSTGNNRFIRNVEMNVAMIQATSPIKAFYNGRNVNCIICCMRIHHVRVGIKVIITGSSHQSLNACRKLIRRLGYLISIEACRIPVDPDDIEMLEDLVAAAVNATVKQVDETAEAEMGKLTGGMNIPGL